MSQIEYNFITQQVFQLQNKARENPQSFIYDLEQRLLNLNNKQVTISNGKQIKTREGKLGIEECINFLRKQQPLYPLQWEDKLSLAAFDHASDIGTKGIITHQGTDGSSLKIRIEKYGKWKNLLGENMSFGIYDPKEIILQLLIDDGVQGRGHRNNLFTPAFSVVGISFTNHAKYHICGVMDYAGQFFEHEMEIMREPSMKAPILFPQSPPSQNVPRQVFQSDKYKNIDKKKQAPSLGGSQNNGRSQNEGRSKIQQIMSLDLNNLGANKSSLLNESYMSQDVSQSDSQNNEQVKQMKNDGKTLTHDMVKSIVFDDLKQIKQTVNNNRNQAQKNSNIQDITKNSDPKIYDHFQSFSTLKDNFNTLSPQEQSFRQTQPQVIIPLIEPQHEPKTKSKAIDSLFNNFLDKRQHKPIVEEIQQSQDLSVVIEQTNLVQSHESSVIQENNFGLQSRQSGMTSSFQRDHSSKDIELDQLIDKLFSQVLVVQKKIKKNLTLNFQTSQSNQFDSQIKLTKRTDTSKDSLEKSNKLQQVSTPKLTNKNLSNPYLKNNEKPTKQNQKIKAINTSSKSNMNTSNLERSKNPIPLGDKSKKSSKQASNLLLHSPQKDQKYEKQGLSIPDTGKGTNRSHKSSKTTKEYKLYPIMCISTYLFGKELLRGPHRMNELNTISDEEIMKYYKNLQNYQEIKTIEELLSAYQYENYSLFLLKSEPQFFTLCLENYNLFLKGLQSEKDKTKWTDIYMPKENHIPYLRSLGFLIDKKTSEFIYKLIQSYYVSKPQQKQIGKNQKTKDELEPTQDKKFQNNYSFDGILLSILACKGLNPNPQSLKDSLSFFDEKKTGILLKAKTQDILVSIGEGVTNEEMKIFYDEFQDWRLYEYLRQQVIQLKKKGVRSQKQKVPVKDTQLKEFTVAEAFKILTILPY